MAVAVAREGDVAADIQAVGGAKVGQRHPSWAARIQEVVGLPDAAAGRAGINRVARWIGWIESQGGYRAGLGAVVERVRANRSPLTVRLRVGRILREDA